MSRRWRTARSLAAFVNGAIRTSEQEEMADLLRRKSQVVVAFGTCAHLGGIPGLANLWDREGIFAARLPRRAQHGEPARTSSAAATTAPDGTVTLPALLRHGEDARPGDRRGLLHPGLPAARRS